MKRQVLAVGMGAIALWSGVAEGSLLLGKGSASAEPAPLFQPLVNDIRDQLPPDLQMRLPADLPESSLRLYPYIEFNDTGFWVNLAFHPDCFDPSCTLGGLGVFTEEASSLPPLGDNVTPVDLGNGIQGYYLTRGPEDGRSRYVFWEQNGLEYAIGVQAFAITQEELVAVARSMAAEPAITSSQAR